MLLECFLGSIPAWAGETRAFATSSSISAVYPRVGGGNVNDESNIVPVDGLSPRGRGKLSAGGEAVAFGRSIPAWAGETNALAIEFGVTPVYPRVGGGNPRLDNNI